LAAKVMKKSGIYLIYIYKKGCTVREGKLFAL
jgi:hypothetical protein